MSVAGPDAHRPFGPLLAMLAVTAFVVGGCIHYQTPMLSSIAEEFGATRAQMGWVPTLSFGGMFAGIVLLVPLGDRVDRRPLILAKLLVLCFAQAAMAAAPTFGVLCAASFLTGVSSSVVQSMMAIVGEGAKPTERGRATGTMFTGLFLGILFGRIAGGMMASGFGWRSGYVLSTTLMAGVLLLMWLRLPHSQPTTQARYGALLRSAVDLMRTHADIRRAAAIQFMLGICYGGFWAVVSPMLVALHALTPARIGLIGLPGAAGILVARPAGRWMDRSGILPVVATALATMIVAWLVLGFAAWTIAAVVVGVVLLDCALRAAMVSNQTLVGIAAPHARARANTVFGTHIWAGNATGAFLASHAFAHVGWLAVCAMALSACAVAVAIHLRARRDRVGATAG